MISKNPQEILNKLMNWCAHIMSTVHNSKFLIIKTIVFFINDEIAQNCYEANKLIVSDISSLIRSNNPLPLYKAYLLKYYFKQFIIFYHPVNFFV